MEANPEYTLCCHAYSMVNKDRTLIEDRFDFADDCDVPMKRLIGNQLLVPQFATLLHDMIASHNLKVNFWDEKAVT